MDTSQCKGCSHWRSMYGTQGKWMCCHHVQDVGQCKIMVDGVCLPKSSKHRRKHTAKKAG